MTVFTACAHGNASFTLPAADSRNLAKRRAPVDPVKRVSRLGGYGAFSVLEQLAQCGLRTPVPLAPWFENNDGLSVNAIPADPVRLKRPDRGRHPERYRSGRTPPVEQRVSAGLLTVSPGNTAGTGALRDMGLVTRTLMNHILAEPSVGTGDQNRFGRRRSHVVILSKKNLAGTTDDRTPKRERGAGALRTAR
jgi:hypothetical protein